MRTTKPLSDKAVRFVDLVAPFVVFDEREYRFVEFKKYWATQAALQKGFSNAVMAEVVTRYIEGAAFDLQIAMQDKSDEFVVYSTLHQFHIVMSASLCAIDVMAERLAMQERNSK